VIYAAISVLIAKTVLFVMCALKITIGIRAIVLTLSARSVLMALIFHQAKTKTALNAILAALNANLLEIIKPTVHDVIQALSST